jgi:uncharacterized protein YaaW (UPF0174 family)
MSLKFQNDPDLQVLHFADNAALAVLARHLTHDSDGGIRRSQSLLDEPRFKEAGTELTKVWDLVAAELQHYGGDSIMSFFRNHGVLYREILLDVCRKLWFKLDVKQSTVQIETELYDFLEQMLWIALPENNMAAVEQLCDVPEHFSAEILLQVKADLTVALRLGAWLSAQIPNLLTLQFRFVVMGRVLPIPLSELAVHIFSQNKLHPLVEVSGPAYRLTIPAVFFIIFLRRILNTDIY